MKNLYQVQVIVGATGLVVAGVEFYPVRELVAALIIFSILFGVMAVSFFTLFLIRAAVLKSLSQIESCVYVYSRYAGRQHGSHVLRGPRWN